MLVAGSFYLLIFLLISLCVLKTKRWVKVQRPFKRAGHQMGLNQATLTSKGKERYNDDGETNS